MEDEPEHQRRRIRRSLEDVILEAESLELKARHTLNDLSHDSSAANDAAILEARQSLTCNTLSEQLRLLSLLQDEVLGLPTDLSRLSLECTEAVVSFQRALHEANQSSLHDSCEAAQTLETAVDRYLHRCKLDIIEWQMRSYLARLQSNQEYETCLARVQQIQTHLGAACKQKLFALKVVTKPAPVVVHAEDTPRLNLNREQFESYERARRDLQTADLFQRMLHTHDVFHLTTLLDKLYTLMQFSASLITPKERDSAKDILKEIFTKMDELDFKTILEILCRQSLLVTLHVQILSILGEYSKGPRIPSYIDGNFDPMKQYQREKLFKENILHYLFIFASQPELVTEVKCKLLDTVTQLCKPSKFLCKELVKSDLLPVLVLYIRSEDDILLKYMEFAECIAQWITDAQEEVLRQLLSENYPRLMAESSKIKALYLLLKKLHCSSKKQRIDEVMEYLSSRYSDASNPPAVEYEVELFDLVMSLITTKHVDAASKIGHFRREWVQSLTCRMLEREGPERELAANLLEKIIEKDHHLVSPATFTNILENCMKVDGKPYFEYGLLPLSNLMARDTNRVVSELSMNKITMSKAMTHWIRHWFESASPGHEGSPNIILIRSILRVAETISKIDSYSIISQTFIDLLFKLTLMSNLGSSNRVLGFEKEIKGRIHTVFTFLKAQYENPKGLTYEELISLNHKKKRVNFLLNHYFDQQIIDMDSKIEVATFDDLKRLFTVIAPYAVKDKIALSSNAPFIAALDSCGWNILRFDLLSAKSWECNIGFFVSLLVNSKYRNRDAVSIEFFKIFEEEHKLPTNYAIKILSLLDFTYRDGVNGPTHKRDFFYSHPHKFVSLERFKAELQYLQSPQPQPRVNIVKSHNIKYTEDYFISMVLRDYKYPQTLSQPILEKMKEVFDLRKGRFDKEELKLVVRAVIGQSAENYVDGFFLMFDEDGDGTLDLLEVLVGLCKVKDKESDWIPEYAFRLIDSDRSGYINEEEFLHFIHRHMESSQSAGDLVALMNGAFDVFDENGDRKLSFSEFRSALGNNTIRKAFENLLYAHT